MRNKNGTFPKAAIVACTKEMVMLLAFLEAGGVHRIMSKIGMAKTLRRIDLYNKLSDKDLLDLIEACDGEYCYHYQINLTHFHVSAE